MRRFWVIGLASMTGIFAVGADAATLTHTPAGAPLCLSVDAPTACNAGGASTHDYTFTIDVSGAIDVDHTISGATLSLNLFDDFGRADGSEKLQLFLDGVQVPADGDVQHDLVLPLADLGSLDDALLTVLLRADTGDFFFGGATLTLLLAERVETPNDIVPPGPTASPVPLPGTLVLLGLGAAALMIRRR